MGNKKVTKKANTAKKGEEEDPPPDQEAMDQLEQKREPDADIEEWFTSHQLTEDQQRAAARVRKAGKAYAQIIRHNCPNKADQTAAIRKVREASMTAIQGISTERSG